MLPLARSLLALAALLSVTEARLANPFCSDLHLGKDDGYPKNNYVDFTITVSGGTITIPDKCSRPGNKIVGESISICNTPNSKPEIWQALQTEYHFKPNFALFHIDCPSNIAGCDRLKVEIRQYCEMVTAPH
ncbi:uncharacterized protein LOC133533802 [Cydia pomonella]|uniref:uncharacterized protein LOC133518311 n=1 Tax=Cydia pomonella TaxID=82600 RepID=UPI002ADE5A33|nr:uncharacterized protein LOC133518311 [Cydia pomonella]XP_061728837.1 uncharacterized protein LOC133533802 [Cydia pomonella]